MKKQPPDLSNYCFVATFYRALLIYRVVWIKVNVETKFLSVQMELNTYEKFINNGIAYSSNTDETTSLCCKSDTNVFIENWFFFIK